MSPRGQLDRLGLRRVPGGRAVMRPVQPDDLSQQMRIRGVRLRPRRRVPFPVAGHRHRAGREHLIPGRHQRGDPRATLGPGPGLHPPGSLTRRQVSPLLRQKAGDQRVQLRHPRQALRQPPPRQPPPIPGDDPHIMMIFSPVITGEQHPASSLATGTAGSAEETTSDLMAKCSPAKPRARHPISGHASSRPAGARSAARPPRPEAKSADPPAATGTETAKPARQKPLDAGIVGPGQVRIFMQSMRPSPCLYRSVRRPSGRARTRLIVSEGVAVVP